MLSHNGTQTVSLSLGSKDLGGAIKTDGKKDWHYGQRFLSSVARLTDSV